MPLKSKQLGPLVGLPVIENDDAADEGDAADEDIVGEQQSPSR
jgi:hypothetical protein